MYHSPYLRSPGVARSGSQQYIRRSPSPFSKSPSNKDRYVSPRSKSPLRSPLREVDNSISEFGYEKKIATPSTPRLRKQPEYKSEPFAATDVCIEKPSKVIDVNSNGRIAIALGGSIYIRSGNDFMPISEDGDRVDALCWSGDQLIVSAAGNIELWDLEESRVVREFQSHDSTAASLSAFGHRLATGGEDGYVIVHDIRSENFSELLHERNEISSVAWNPDGDTLAASAGVHVTTLGRSNKHRYSHSDTVSSLAWANSGVVISADRGEFGNIVMYQTKSGKTRSTATNSPVNGICVLENWGVAAAHESGVWDLWQSDLRKYGTFEGHVSAVLDIAGARDSSIVATISADETLRIWEICEPKTAIASPAIRRTPTPVSSPFKLIR